MKRSHNKKPCYRKDERAMRHLAYMGALKIFGRPCMATPTANFPDIFNGLLFRSIPWLCVQNLKFVHLPASEIGLIVIGVLGGGCKAQSSGREGWWALMSSYRPFPLSLRVSEIHRYCRLCAPAHHFPQWLTSSYRTMHYSAQRGIAIACRPSVCLSVRLSVRPSVRPSVKP